MSTIIRVDLSPPTVSSGNAVSKTGRVCGMPKNVVPREVTHVLAHEMQQGNHLQHVTAPPPNLEGLQNVGEQRRNVVQRTTVPLLWCLRKVQRPRPTFQMSRKRCSEQRLITEADIYKIEPEKALAKQRYGSELCGIMCRFADGCVDGIGFSEPTRIEMESQCISLGDHKSSDWEASIMGTWSQAFG